MTGSARTADGFEHAFLWDGTAMLDLGTLGGFGSEGRAINDSGQVTGDAGTADGEVHAFLWTGTTMQDLGTFGGTQSGGTAINASGQVTGFASADPDDVSTHVFLWDGTMMVDLGALEGSEGSAGQAINASGHVTGLSFRGDGVFHALLWDGTALHDLNALIDPADPLQPFVTLTEGADINDLGQILAQGIDSRTSEEHAYLLTPFSAPEPGTVALLGLGLAGLGLARRRRVN